VPPSAAIPIGTRRVVSAIEIPDGVFEAAGLSAAEALAWAETAAPANGAFVGAEPATGEFLRRGLALRQRLPARPRRVDAEHVAAAAIGAALDDARETFLRHHATTLYDMLTAGFTRYLRLDQLCYDAAARVPGLTPSRSEMSAERDVRLADKEGIELAQGLFLSHVLASPRTGRHLIDAMLRPTPEALAHLEEFRATGVCELGPVRVTRRGRAGFLELSNPRHLNAEDGVTLGPTESGIDLILLDPAIEVGVLRGAVTDHPRYAGQRVFGSGINLTHLYHGRIDFLFYLDRDLGYVNKIYRGVSDPATTSTREKLWIAAVERFAIGGACQLLHVMDHVIAAHGARLYLPARQEGIIPGASNLRLPRFVGDRAARQAILSGREWTAGEPDAALICDEVVAADEVDQVLEARIEALTSSGLVNAAANRAALRVGQEPLDLFRSYMATYAREQAYCHLSPALVRNLEQHWNADRRSI
jgi:thioesterase DpgC